MLFKIPLAIWLGGLTIISLLITLTFGILMFYYKKPVFKWHKYFAFLTAALAIIHATFAFLLWFYGIVI